MAFQGDLGCSLRVKISTPREDKCFGRTDDALVKLRQDYERDHILEP